MMNKPVNLVRPNLLKSLHRSLILAQPRMSPKPFVTHTYKVDTIAPPKSSWASHSARP